MSSGKVWAAASARTLTRRLRRDGRANIGHSAATALAFRTKLFRASLSEHWALSTLVGANAPNFSDAVEGARLLGGVQADKLTELLLLRDTANWARHAPPPGLARLAAIPKGEVFAHDLERFRAQLYLPIAGTFCAEQVVTDAGKTLVIGSVFNRSAVRSFWNKFVLPENDVTRYDNADMHLWHPQISDIDGGVKMQSGVSSSIDAVVHGVLVADNPEFTIAVPTTGDVAVNSPRTAKREAFMRTMRL